MSTGHTAPNRGVTPGLPTNNGSFKATEQADSGVALAVAPRDVPWSEDPFVGTDAAWNRAAIRAVSTYFAINPFPGYHEDLNPTHGHIANALVATGVRPDEPVGNGTMVTAIHGRLATESFTDEDGEHAPQAWSTLDADDRYPGHYTLYCGGRDGARMTVDEGDASSYANPGFSWRMEIGPHLYSGQADSLAQAQREAINAADYVTSGRVEADVWAAYDADPTSDSFDPFRD